MRLGLAAVLLAAPLMLAVPGPAWAERGWGGYGGGSARGFREDHYGTRRNFRQERIYQLPRVGHLVRGRAPGLRQ